MAVPKKKTTQGRRNMRRGHHALTAAGISIDKETKSVHRPHHVDLKTGMYNGRQVLFVEDEAEEVLDAEVVESAEGEE